MNCRIPIIASLLLAFCLAGAIPASASSEPACRSKFNQIQASQYCRIHAFIKFEKPGRYWQCAMQLRCEDSNGRVLWSPPAGS